MTSFQQIAKRAVSCDYCFRALGLTHAQINIAQPRWVGPRYRRAFPKVVVIMINPGAGERRDGSVHQRRRLIIQKFRDGKATLNEVFDEQRADFENFGRRRFKPFIETSLTLAFDDIALLNIAWCATKRNEYPPEMLAHCFNEHTRPALIALKPNAVILCGGKAHRFNTSIRNLLPDAAIFNVPHYAQRRGPEFERLGTGAVRDFMSSERQRTARNANDSGLDYVR